MLINFTDTYINDILAGYRQIGDIQNYICQKEPFMGNSQALDKLHTISVLISIMIDQLSHDDNANPAQNHKLLLCLRKNINKAQQMCGPCRRPLIDVRNLHNKPAAMEVVHTLHN